MVAKRQTEGWGETQVNMRSLIFVFGFLLTSNCMAVKVLPSSYDIANGFSGTYPYWDDLYTGAGCKTCDGALLTGGLGDLTDGVIASGNWFVDEAPAGPGPYVGWGSNPTITFHFGSVVAIDSITLSVDDSGGSGGVNSPSSITIGATTYPVTDPAGTAPFSFTVSGLGFVGSTLGLVVNRSGPAVFVSEVSFQSPVPELGSAATLLAGLSVVAFVVSRRSRPALHGVVRYGSVRSGAYTA